MGNFVRKINWELLRAQKNTLIKVIEKKRDKNSYRSDPKEAKEINDLDGLLHLIDGLQDWAVDEEGANEKLVFGK